MISLSAARKMKKLEVTEDNTVFTRIRFTRCLYAQLASQKFDCPKPFRLAGYKRSKKDPQKLNYDLGVKISCGLEMLYQLGRQRRNKTEVSLFQLRAPVKITFLQNTGSFKIFQKKQLRNNFWRLF